MASTYRTPNSWGRTRRPKQLYQHLPGDQRQAQTSVNVVTEAQLDADLSDTNEGRNGYSTENQRYLHVLVKTGSNKSVTIYGYNYAFGEWAPLYLPLGNATMTAATAATGGSGEVRQYIFEVAGVDRVAFVSSDAPSVCRAACSTF